MSDVESAASVYTATDTRYRRSGFYLHYMYSLVRAYADLNLYHYLHKWTVILAIPKILSFSPAGIPQQETGITAALHDTSNVLAAEM